MHKKVITPADYKTLRWKNGLGSTRELLREPRTGQDDFSWRLSMAPVTSDGAFSDFSGYQRTLVLIEGEGITLRHDQANEDVLARRLDMAHFDGGQQTVAKLHQGAITDFNVMTRLNLCHATVTSLVTGGYISVDADWLVVYSLDTELEFQAPATAADTVQPDHLLAVTSPTPGSWHCGAGAALIVQIYWHG